jgi:hypothetical protein
MVLSFLNDSLFLTGALAIPKLAPPFMVLLSPRGSFRFLGTLSISNSFHLIMVLLGPHDSFCLTGAALAGWLVRPYWCLLI